MKKILSIITIIMLLSTVICGFWIASQETVAQSSLEFHKVSALMSVLLTLLTLFIGRKQRVSAN